MADSEDADSVGGLVALGILAAIGVGLFIVISSFGSYRKGDKITEEEAEDELEAIKEESEADTEEETTEEEEETEECTRCGREAEYNCHKCDDPICSFHATTCDYCGYKFCDRCSYPRVCHDDVGCE